MQTTAEANLRRLLARHPDLVGLAGILALAVSARLIWLETIPPNVTADEADNLQTIYHIVAGDGPGPFGLDWKQIPAFNTYLMAGAMSLVGWTIPAMRLPSALLSALALIPFYLLARRAAGAAAGLLAALLLSTNAWFLNFSRSGWENVWISLFLLGAMYCLTLGLERGRMEWFLGAGGCCALGLYGYYAGRIVLPILLAYLPLALWLHRPRARAILLGYALMVVCCLTLFAPQAATIVRDWGPANMRTNAVLVTTEAQSPAEAMHLLWQQMVICARAFLLLQPDLPYNGRYNQIGTGVLDAVTGALYWAGLLFGAWRWRRTSLWWAALLLGLLPLQVLTRGIPDGARAVAFAPILYLFVALALGELLRLRWVSRALWVPILGVVLVSYQTFDDYVRWMQTTQVAQARQPAVEVAEFPSWQALQIAEARAGRFGFNVSEWQKRRTTSAIGAAAPTPAGGSPPVALPAHQGVPEGAVGRVLHRIELAGNQPLREPFGVAIARAGNVYVADTGNARIAEYASTGELLAQWGSRGESPGQFVEPFALAVDADDHVFVLDSSRAAVERFGADGTHQATLLADAGMYRPRGLTLDASGHLYVADTGRNRVLQASPTGEVLKSWTNAGDDTLAEPTGVAVDTAGNLYVVQPSVGRLDKIGLDGRVLARRALLPTNTREAPHVTLAPDGQLVLADTGGERVGLLAPDLTWVATLADEKNVSLPVGVTATQSGEVWVADPRGNAALLVSRPPTGATVGPRRFASAF